MIDLNKLISDAQVAIEFWEDIDAKRILKKLRAFIVENKIEQADQALFAKLQKWIVYLQLVAFPSLSDQECGEILRDHYLESFRINVPMENRITGKLFLFPYLARDEVREVLKRGLAGNVQNLGTQTIGQWIQEFEKEFNVHSRTESAPVQFVRQSPKVSTLSPIEQRILKETLHIYDYLLVSNLPAEGEDLQNLMESGVLEKESGAYGEQTILRSYGSERPSSGYVQNNGEKAGQNVVKISLLEALKQYPALGEQAITSNPIKLRYFPTPVKPSIKNWITDYHEALGAGKHSTMDRGNFLFHGENGKRLTQMERQKVSLMLKSLDEEMLLSIDGDAQKIIFEIASQSPAAPSSENVQQSPQPAVSVQPRATFQAAPSRENSPEDIAQARIRQSLNFAKVEPAQFAKNENKAKIFDFEDSNYANTLREKISEQEKPVMGAFSFSSAQELPVEKQAAAPIQKPVQNFDMPVQQTKVAPVRTAPTWNSPDFKKQISQEKPQEKNQEMPREMPKETLQVEKMPADVFAKNQPSQPQRVYSPYLIGPSKNYISGQGGAVAPGQAEPKVKGNMVDLS